MYIKIKVSHLVVGIVLLSTMLWAGIVLAGDPDSSGEPSATNSYSLEDLYQRLSAGAVGTSRVFTEPTTAPGVGTMHSINEIMAVAPALDTTNGATTTQVVSGTTFWGLTSGQWGVQTGTLEITPCDCSGGTLTGSRWCDNGDGTVTDLLGDTTNNNVGQCLVWLQNANCSADLAGINKTDTLNWDDAVVWSSAVKYGSCGLKDGSTGYEWRLPTRAELDGITNGTDQVLSSSMQAFTGVQSGVYWSSTTYAPIPFNAWFVDLHVGLVLFNVKTLTFYVWPVRGGQ